MTSPPEKELKGSSCRTPWIVLNLSAKLGNLMRICSNLWIKSESGAFSVQYWSSCRFEPHLNRPLAKKPPPPPPLMLSQRKKAVLQSRSTKQEICHTTKTVLNLSLLMFSEDDCCMFMTMDGAATTGAPPPPPIIIVSTATVATEDTTWRSDLSLQIRKTSRLILKTLLPTPPGPSYKHGMPKCVFLIIWKWRSSTFMSLNHKIIILRKLNICMQERGYIWKLFISECGAMGRGGGQIWQTVLRVEPATVATVTVWLTAVWFGF